MSCDGKEMKKNEMKLTLKVEGKEIPMVKFVHDAFRDMIVAFANNLKGHEGGNIEITIEE